MNIKKILLATCAGMVMTAGVTAQTKGIRYANTLPVLPTDSKEVIIEKAAHIVPTKNQLEALKNEFIAFVHFGPNTFTRREWGTGMEDPRIFDLKNLDTDQWVETMKAAGMKMVLLTVKHHDGFVLWQSRYTKHGIMSSPFLDGKGDVLRDLSASCQKYGLKLGIYLSPADLYQIESPDGLYGNLSKYTERTIPREVPGRPFKNKKKFKFVVDDYNEYFLNQLFELLTEYGPISEVWFDGAHPKRKGGQRYNYMAWKKLIHTLAPKAVIFGREDIRWCGNESGATRDTEWNVVAYPQNPDTATVFPDMTNEDLGSREVLYGAKFLHYQQPETNTSIREGWFYRDDDNQKVRDADDIFDIFERSVGGNSTFLLNIPPNRDGRFSDKDVNSLKEVGRRIAETYGTNLLCGAKAAKAVLDADLNTFVEVAAGKSLEITTPTPITFNRLVLQEAISKRSERVENHAVDAWVDGGWKQIAQATNIGYKRILRFPDVTTDRIRIRVEGARLVPGIATVSAHYYKARLPRLEMSRDRNGMITLRPSQNAFGWKSHGRSIAENLNRGMKIVYTTDGSAPTASSQVYTERFLMDRGKLQAMAVLNGESGPLLQETIGLPKANWKSAGVSGQTDKNPLTASFDENPSTYWLAGENTPAFMIIDLSDVCQINGFAYTPVPQRKDGMMAKGVVKVSNDGRNWTTVETFEFGNLINDPTKRYHYFKQPVSAQYLRIEVTELAGNGKQVAVAEIDVL